MSLINLTINGKAVAVKQYVGRLPYEKFKDPTNPDLNSAIFYFLSFFKFCSRFLT